MENARVFLVEDDENFINLVKTVLNGSENNHRLIDYARSRSEALQKLDSMRHKPAEERCNVVILDGNLSHDTSNGEDAKHIYERIRHLGLPMRIIGFSTFSLSREYNIPVDTDPTKFAAAYIDEYIDELDEPEVA